MPAARLGLARDRYATVIHPSVVLPGDAVLGVGCVLLPGVVATTSIELGDHVQVEAGTVLTHDESVVGLGAAVLTDVPDAELWVGVPARQVKQLSRPA